MLRAILGSHERLAFYPWDLPLWTEIYADHTRAQGLSTVAAASLALSRHDARALVLEILAGRKGKWPALVAKRDEIIHAVDSQHRRTFGSVFDTVMEAYRASTGRARWGLKTPYNEWYADAIFLAHPDAVMIQLIRDPRDVLASQRNYGRHVRHWYNPVAYSRAWRRSAAAAITNARRYADRYLVIRYEDLVGDPEVWVRRACDLAKVEYESSLLNMQGHVEWTGSNSSHERLGRGPAISTESRGRFRDKLSDAEIWLSQNITGRYGPALGYDTVVVRLGMKSRIEILRHASASLAGRVKTSLRR